MEIINTTLISMSRERMKTQMTNIARGQGRTGKEMVREGMSKLQSQSDERHKKIINKFVEEEGKGVKINVKI
ncbi:MAG: hypothetical protein HY279_03005 [Nitrospinae bacterium]|nr:hypothetical protein [Nitrospinota bacterium]